MGKVVQTAYGKVEGFSGDGVNKWFGIPFAKPPVGELRFRHAQAPDPWEGVKQCFEFGDCCWQFTSGGMEGMGGTAAPASEDCLYLNVWAPQDAPRDGEKLPVFVWIYGGAYHMGEASSPGFDLTSFAKQGVIGVSFNYRLGPLGFYDFSRMSPRFDANCAVSDMVAALKWIQGSIEAFGGDPGNVTVCGESAGGTMTFCAMACPEAKGLFHKAIPMSGIPNNANLPVTHDKNVALFLDELGLDASNVEKLVDMSYEEMYPAAEKMFKSFSTANPGMSFPGPVAGDSLLPLPITEALAQGMAEGVKVMIGTCRDEGRFFVLTHEAATSWEQIGQMLDVNGFGDKLDEFKAVYGDDEGEPVACVATDRMFWIECVRCALAQSQHGDTYMYRFDFVPAAAGRLGASHTMDTWPGLDVYTSGAGPSFYNGTPLEVEERIHKALNGAFVNFCKTGDPGNATGVAWPKYEPQHRATMLIDDPCSVVEDPNRQRFDVWEGVDVYK